MRHHWDYGGSDAYNTRHRSCTVCGLSARRFGYGRSNTAWTYRRPDGSSFYSTRTPECPGKPVTEGSTG